MVHDPERHRLLEVDASAPSEVDLDVLCRNDDPVSHRDVGATGARRYDVIGVSNESTLNYRLGKLKTARAA